MLSLQALRDEKYCCWASKKWGDILKLPSRTSSISSSCTHTPHPVRVGVVYKCGPAIESYWALAHVASPRLFLAPTIAAKIFAMLLWFLLI